MGPSRRWLVYYLVRWTSIVLPLLAAALTSPARAQAPGGLRVCADPNNLPFTNRRMEGFENRIADLLARDMRARLSYTWWAQRRGFFRITLKAGLCDVVLGVPAGFEMAATTRARIPWRSSISTSSSTWN